MIWNAFLLALREIRNNLLRASLTTLGIVIGVAAVILMVTLDRRDPEGHRRIRSLGQQSSGSSPASGTARRRPSRRSIWRSSRDSARHPKPRRSRPRARGTGRARQRQPQPQQPGQRHDQFLHAQPQLGLSRGANSSPAEILAGKSVCIIGETDRRELFGDASADRRSASASTRSAAR